MLPNKELTIHFYSLMLLKWAVAYCSPHSNAGSSFLLVKPRSSCFLIAVCHPIFFGLHSWVLFSWFIMGPVSFQIPILGFLRNSLCLWCVRSDWLCVITGTISRGYSCLFISFKLLLLEWSVLTSDITEVIFRAHFSKALQHVLNHKYVVNSFIFNYARKSSLI